MGESAQTFTEPAFGHSGGDGWLTRLQARYGNRI